MTKRLLSALLIAAAAFGADMQWSLEKSTLTYHVSHPLHQIDGVSHAAKGKAVCHAGDCEFLIAVPVKSFDSGDSNRDVHMIQVVRGAEYPMATVRFHLPESAAASGTVHPDLQVELAGQTAEYRQAAFQVNLHGNEADVTGTIPAKMSDFHIQPPSLLTIPTKDEMPIKVSMTWHRQ
jgi:hypothetical protein